MSSLSRPELFQQERSFLVFLRGGAIKTGEGLVLPLTQSRIVVTNLINAASELIVLFSTCLLGSLGKQNIIHIHYTH